jgi:hypothetical protein
MIKKCFTYIALCTTVLMINCAVFIAPPEQTSVEVTNNLNGMNVEINGTITHVLGIDLENIQIGDVYYNSILYGTTSDLKITERLGDVPVIIGTAIVYTDVLNQSVPITFSNISSMSTTITADVINTVVFNQTTAETIFNSLAKK